MKKYNIPINNVVQHNHWSGKDCPKFLRSGSAGINWNGFITKVKQDTTVVAQCLKEKERQKEEAEMQKQLEAMQKQLNAAQSRVATLEKKVNVENDLVNSWADDDWKEACENGYYDGNRAA